MCLRRETPGQFRVLRLRGQGLGPVQRQVEVAATVVQFADLARRRGEVARGDAPDAEQAGAGQDQGLQQLSLWRQTLAPGAPSGCPVMLMIPPIPWIMKSYPARRA